MPVHDTLAGLRLSCTRAYPQTQALQVEEDSRERDHTQVVVATLLVARRNAAKLLEPVDQLLYLRPQLVELLVERPAPARTRRRKPLAGAELPAASARAEEAEETASAPVPAHTPTPPAGADAVTPPSPGSGRRKRAPRQPVAPEIATTSQADGTVPQQPVAASTSSPTAAGLTVSVEAEARGGERLVEGETAAPTEPQAGSVGAEATATPSEPPTPRRRNRMRAAGSAVATAVGGTDGLRYASDKPGAVAATAAEVPGALGDDQHDRDRGAMSTGAVEMLAGAARPEAPERAVAPPLVAVVSSSATALELSADEVRLLYSYRRLHPHGRRATLQYIGSLLVEE